MAFFKFLIHKFWINKSVLNQMNWIFIWSMILTFFCSAHYIARVKPCNLLSSRPWFYHLIIIFLKQTNLFELLLVNLILITEKTQRCTKLFTTSRQIYYKRLCNRIGDMIRHNRFFSLVNKFIRLTHAIEIVIRFFS